MMMNEKAKRKKEGEEGIAEEQSKYDVLQDKKLLLNIIIELQKTVAGNEDMMLAAINKICLRLVSNANDTSSNAMITEESGSGKDWITKQVCSVLVPSDMYHHVTDISEKLLNYWVKPSKDHKTFDGHVLHLEDPNPERLSQQAFKVRASGNNEIRFVQKGKAVHKQIIGKPVIFVTTLSGAIDKEGMRRWDILSPDKSSKVTELLIKMRMESECDKNLMQSDSRLRAGLRALKRVSVIIPYAPVLIKSIPNRLIMRTQMDKLLDYIRSSAALHQYQRKKDEDGNIIANIDDYAYGRFCFMFLKDYQGTALGKYEKDVVEVLNNVSSGLDIKEIASRVDGLSLSRCYSRGEKPGLLDNMKEKGIVSMHIEDTEQYPRALYSLNDNYIESIDLPSPSSVRETFSLIFKGSLEQRFNHFRAFLELICIFSHFQVTCIDINKIRKESGLIPISFANDTTITTTTTGVKQGKIV
jgi:hypothetical protein